jgi:hypothetical protein
MTKTFIWMGLIACGEMIYYKDKKYNYIEYFNEQNGTLVRSNILKDGIETSVTPVMRSFPELIDIGIMGTCHASKHGICLAAGVDCYQNALSKQRANMTLENYMTILKQCSGRTFQIALGGAGDPNKHEEFEHILRATVEHRIVPNLTTSGHNISSEEISLIKKYCGAVAVSYYSRLDANDMETNPTTGSAIRSLVNAGCTTNVHYVLSKVSVKEATKRLKNKMFPEGINAIVFLLYKPVGLADKSKMLTSGDSDYLDFLRTLNESHFPYKIGLDSCQAPAILNFCPSISSDSIEFCDAARFSMYIDCDMNAYPCSFGHDHSGFKVDLNNESIKDAWLSSQFELFRKHQENICFSCNTTECRNCALDLDISVCGQCK